MHTIQDEALERRRLAVLRSLNLLDSAPDHAYDRITALAARLFDVPIALISLVDDHRQWFKSKVGLDACETDREHAFCAHAIASVDLGPFVVEDALQDARFAHNPLVVGPPNIRFYAGQPLIVQDVAIGTLCVIDSRPRSLTPSEIETLRDLAWVVERLVNFEEMRFALVEVDRAERRKRQIFATMVDGLVVQSLDGVIVDWNPAAERVLGLTADELAGRSSIDPRWHAVRADGSVWPGEQHPAMEALRTGTSVQNATMGIDRGGPGLGWLRVNSSPVIEQDGQISGAITSFADITELVAAELRLRALERMQRSTLDLLEQGVMVGGPEGTVMLMNSAAERILGIGIDDTSDPLGIGEWISFDQHGVELPERAVGLTQVFTSVEPMSGEIMAWTRRDGRRVVLSVSTAPIPDGTDTLMIAFSDVTEQIRERQLLNLTIERAPNGMALIDHRGRFVTVNEALCGFLGRTSDELASIHYSDVTHPDGLVEDERRIALLLSGTCDHYEMDRRYVRPDGEVVSAHLAVAIVRSPTMPQPYFIAQVVDLRERVEAERLKDDALDAERSAVAKLVELDRIKSDFVSTVSHELRTPLTSMLGYIELLAEAHVGSNEEEAVMIDAIERNAHRLRLLIEDLLILSKVELDRHDPARIAVDVDALIASAVSSLRPLVSRAGLVLAVNVDPGLHPVFGNSSELDRVMLNLISNAIKFTPRGGSVEISAHQQGREVLIEVRDNGVGIPAAELPELFTQFFRSSTARANVIPGTGLGLAISLRIVEAHGGWIRAESKQDEGSAFVVGLPTVERSPISPQRPVGDVPATAGELSVIS